MVLPVHDVNPARRTPWVTYGLIAANVVFFLLTPAASMMFAGDADPALLCQQEEFYLRYGAVPTEMVTNEQLSSVPTGAVLMRDGVSSCVTGPPAYDKEPALSVLYSMFLHGSWLHLLGNMLFLWVFGNNIEDRLGHLRYLLFYVFAGYLAAYGFAFANPDLSMPLIGASGAVAGVLGAYIVIYPRVPVVGVVPVLFFLPVRLPAWFVLGSWFVLQGIYSAGYAITGSGSVAYLAHVTGFAFGFLVAIPLRMRMRPPKPKPQQSAYIYRKEW